MFPLNETSSAHKVDPPTPLQSASKGALPDPALTGETALQDCLPTWMTSRLAAPARPTLIVTGFTKALLAKFCIFLGMVALKSRVCR